MKPVIFITIYRRYHELLRNIDWVWECSKELKERPDVVVLWNSPQIEKVGLFQKLLADRKITHLITRIGGKDSITVEESQNIREGLEFIDSFYIDYFVIFQTIDIRAKPGIYGYIEGELYQGKQAVVFHWENRTFSRRGDVFHTNFWALKNKIYWPPVILKESPDVLERYWAVQIRDNNLSNFTVSTNSRDRRFIHNHESDKLPPFTFSCNMSAGVFMYINGYMSPWKRFIQWLKS